MALAASLTRNAAQAPTSSGVTSRVLRRMLFGVVQHFVEMLEPRPNASRPARAKWRYPDALFPELDGHIVNRAFERRLDRPHTP